MKYFAIAVFATLLIACSGGDSVEITAETSDATDAAALSVPQIADRLIADGKRLSGTLSEVNSVETAEAVLPRIQALGEEYRTLFEGFDNQGDLGFSDITALASRLPQLAETQKTLASEVQRIYRDHPEAATVLRDTLDDIGRAAENVDPPG